MGKFDDVNTISDMMHEKIYGIFTVGPMWWQIIQYLDLTVGQLKKQALER